MGLTRATLQTRATQFSGAGPHTIKAEAQNGVVVVDSADPATVNLPDNTEVVFPVGTYFFVVEKGAGAVTVALPGSDSIQGTVSTVGQGDMLLVVKIGDGEWDAGKLS